MTTIFFLLSKKRQKKLPFPIKLLNTHKFKTRSEHSLLDFLKRLKVHLFYLLLFNYKARDNLNGKAPIIMLIRTHLTRVGRFNWLNHLNEQEL